MRVGEIGELSKNREGEVGILSVGKMGVGDIGIRLTYIRTRRRGTVLLCQDLASGKVDSTQVESIVRG